MRSRRKIVDIRRHRATRSSVSQIRDLGGRCLKDLHLIEAALATDRIVVSLDERARRELAVDASKDIVWVNAVLEGGHAVYWLRNGAPDKEEWKLGQTGLDTIQADAKKAPISRGRLHEP